MFEKYVGRKSNPEVTVLSDADFLKTKRAWVECCLQNRAFIDWFSTSVVKDDDGLPLPVFHGTRGKLDFEALYRSENLREMGVHFGSIDTANDRLGQTRKSEDLLSPQELFSLEDATLFDTLQGEKIYPVFLKICNPIRLQDHGSLSDDKIKEIKKDLVKHFLTRYEVPRIKSVSSIQDLREALIEMGHDGVVYKNLVEGEKGMDSFIPIINSEQIWPAFLKHHL